MIDTILAFFLNGKLFWELDFPDGWIYDPLMCRYRSEKHKVKLTGSDNNIRYKYIYITDTMLCNAHSS